FARNCDALTTRTRAGPALSFGAETPSPSVPPNALWMRPCLHTSVSGHEEEPSQQAGSIAMPVTYCSPLPFGWRSEVNFRSIVSDASTVAYGVERATIFIFAFGCLSECGT